MPNEQLIYLSLTSPLSLSLSPLFHSNSLLSQQVSPFAYSATILLLHGLKRTRSRTFALPVSASFYFIYIFFSFLCRCFYFSFSLFYKHFILEIMQCQESKRELKSKNYLNKNALLKIQQINSVLGSHEIHCFLSYLILLFDQIFSTKKSNFKQQTTKSACQRHERQ